MGMGTESWEYRNGNIGLSGTVRMEIGVVGEQGRGGKASGQ